MLLIAVKWAEEFGFPAGFVGNLNLEQDEDKDGFDEDIENDDGDEDDEWS